MVLAEIKPLPGYNLYYYSDIDSYLQLEAPQPKETSRAILSHPNPKCPVAHVTMLTLDAVQDPIGVVSLHDLTSRYGTVSRRQNQMEIRSKGRPRRKFRVPGGEETRTDITMWVAHCQRGGWDGGDAALGGARAGSARGDACFD